MTLDEIRSQLGTARGVPRAALAAAVEQAEALAPEVVDLLDLACKGVMLTAPQENLLLYGVHALAAARRPELYEPLLALIEWRPDDIEVLLRDTELHLLLISCCGPEGEAPFDLLDNPNVPGHVKCSLFLLIARLVWEGRASREKFVALLDRFDREAMAESGDMAWLGWQHAISLLGVTEFEDRVRAGWQAGRLPLDRPQDREEWLEELREAVQEPGDPARFGPHHAEPVTDVFATLAWVGLLEPDEPNDDMDDPDDPAHDIRLTQEEEDWLADFLLSEMASGVAMSAPCLDGYLTALVAGPIAVPRAEWWSRIWSDLDDQEPAFETDAQQSYVNELVDRHLETIRRRLKTGYRHQPWVDVTSMTISVEEWAIGFSIAMGLRPGAWDPIAEHRQAGLAVTSVYLLLPEEMLGEDWEPIDDEARALIVKQLPDLIQMAYAFWHDQPVLPLFQPRRSAKIGRNEPCPCGSGRKYKMCCGAN